MNEPKSEPASAETDSRGSTTAASEAGPVQAATNVESPGIAPNQEETAPMADAPRVESKVEPRFEAPKPDVQPDVSKAETPKTEMPKAETPRIDAPRIDAPKVETSKAEAARIPGNVTIMSPGERNEASAKAEAGAGRRRVGAMAAVVALATVAGAIGGALATAGIGHLYANDAASARNAGFEASVARLDADILALKASVEQNARAATGQLNKTSDRLDKVEKAQAEPNAKLAKLSDAVEKLRNAQAAATAAAAQAPAATHAASSTPAASKDITGSVPPTTAAAASAKADVGRLPTVEGWVLREVGRGFALIEGRRGMYEVYAGDPIPGLGRVDAIRKQDGRWVVVTSKGLIVER